MANDMNDVILGPYFGGQIGKGNYIKNFMDDIGATLVYEGYQIVWIL